MHKVLDTVRSFLTGAWNRTARACASLSRSTLAWSGLALAAVILLVGEPRLLGQLA